MKHHFADKPQSGGRFPRQRPEETVLPNATPARIKLCNHIRSFATMILVHHLFKISDITLPIGRRQGTCHTPALKQPTSIGGEQRNGKSGISQLPFDLCIIGTVLFKRYIFTLGNV